MGKVRIGIIDSGIEQYSKNIDKVCDFFVLDKNAQSEYLMLRTDPFDAYGHGTAVADIIIDVNPDVELYCFCLSEEKCKIDEQALIYVLNYIYHNIDLDIINISLGYTYLSDYYSLKEICKKIRGKGMLLVSAMDNDGAISYPAALDEVIGVDVDGKIRNKDTIQKVENSIVDICLPDICYRTCWNNRNTIVFGSSFASAKVTGLLSQKLDEYQREDNDDQILESIANKSFKTNEPMEICRPEFSIEKAIVFPINKESRSILLFSELLYFSLVGAYDERLNGNIGKEIGGYKVVAYSEIDWESDFDTIILACTNELSELTGRDYKKEFVEKAKKFKKKIYSFEMLPEKNENFFYPFLHPAMVPHNNIGKLHKTMLPIVGIMGTSSKQGKYTLQLELIKRMRERGYNTGHIATEPSGYLFGADYTFHFGYHANLNLSPFEMILLLNQMVWNVQLTGRDIAFAGCQSNTVHYVANNLGNLPIDQYAFLLGIQADYYILCVNPHDELEYVSRTIQFINSIDTGKVMAVVVFPVKMTETFLGQKFQKSFLDKSESDEVVMQLKNEFQLPTFVLDDSKQLA